MCVCVCEFNSLVCKDNLTLTHTHKRAHMHKRHAKIMKTAGNGIAACKNKSLLSLSTASDLETVQSVSISE